MLHSFFLLSCVVDIAMPATRNGTSDQPHATAPYSLAGASKPQLAAFTAAALKSHLKHFKLSVSGTKATLVDQLHSHLQSIQETGTNNVHVADTSDLQTHAASQGNGTSSSLWRYQQLGTKRACTRGRPTLVPWAAGGT